MVKDRLSLYIIYSNFTLRRFDQAINKSNLTFVEHPHMYSIQNLFKAKGTSNKNKFENLYNYKGDLFIAN